MKKILFVSVLFSIMFLSACNNKTMDNNTLDTQEGNFCDPKESLSDCETWNQNLDFKITTTAFQSWWSIPIRYSCMWKNVNPELEISWVPKWTQSFTLIIHDPDAPKWDWIHWFLLNIPANIKKINEWENPIWAKVNKNSRWKSEYRWPCPPSWTHRYYFKLYALDTNYWDLPEQMTLEEFEKNALTHIIWSTEIMWTYSAK